MSTTDRGKGSQSPSGGEPTVAAGRSGADALLDPMPEQLGRYTILQRIGFGGMGVVYAAYDPTLDRKVALKVLRPKTRTGAQAAAARRRLQREAQAIAKLADPHVIAVYDVGSVADGVFVAMELVEGTTLGRWLRAQPRDWTEILGMFVQAGGGLASAHAAGLCHRDFKPDNVLIGDDGRARVLDFGLARSTEPGSSSDAPAAAAPPEAIPTPSGGHDLVATLLTEDGVVLGTPTYMAPEQHAGERATAASDQYAFCVALFEALFGIRPFAGHSHRELAKRKYDGKLAPIDRSSPVPIRIRKAIEQGLHPAASHRHRDMNRLLDALRPPAHARRRTLGAIVGTIGAAALGGALWWAATRPDPCTAGSAKIDETWHAGRAAAVRTAFAETGVSYAAQSGPRVVELLDAYADRWSEQYRTTCRAAGRAESLDEPMRCLSLRRSEVEALVANLEHADAEVVRRSVQATALLTPVHRCAQSPAAHQPEPAIAADVAAVRMQLANARILESLGRIDEAETIAAAARDTAQGIAFVPLVAEAQLVVGLLADTLGEYERAEATLRDAVMLANSIGHDEVAAAGAIELVFVVGTRQGRDDEALRWARHAAASMGRLDGDARDRAGLLIAEGGLHTRRGAYAEARDAYAEALRLNEAEYGPQHHEVATALNNLGTALSSLGDYEAAHERFARAHRVYEAIVGPEHPDVALALDNLGNVLGRMGRSDEAIQALDRALAIRTAVYGPDHPELAGTLNNLGSLHESLGHYAQARGIHRRALAIFEASVGAESMYAGASRTNIGLSFVREGQFARGRAELQKAVRLLERSLGPNHPWVAHALMGLGQAELGAGDPATAADTSSRALRICDDAEVEPELRAEAAFTLAKALWQSGGDPHRARQLAHRARREFAKNPQGTTVAQLESRQALRRWLEAHRAP